MGGVFRHQARDWQRETVEEVDMRLVSETKVRGRVDDVMGI